MYKYIYLFLRYGAPVIHFVYNMKPLYIAIFDLFSFLEKLKEVLILIELVMGHVMI